MKFRTTAIEQAKTPATRERRIAKTVELLRDGRGRGWARALRQVKRPGS